MDVRFYLNNKVYQNGNRLIMCSYSHETGKPWRFSAKIRVNPKDWNKRNQRVRASHKFALQINKTLDDLAARLEATAYGIWAEGRNPTPDVVKREYERPDASGPQFWEIWDRYQREHVRELAPSTVRRYNVMTNTLKRYEKTTGRELDVSNITSELLAEIRDMMARGGNIKDTQNRKLRDLRAFLGWVERNNLAPVNPSFRAWKLPMTQKLDLVALTDDDLKQLAEFPHESPSHRKAVDLFLFHADTGLRYKEGQILQPGCVREMILTYGNAKGKNRDTIQRRLTRRAAAIIDQYGGTPPKLSNQKYNEYIKEAAKNAGLTRKVRDRGNVVELYRAITTHTARHTFATRMMDSGVDIRIVSKMLGHRDVKVTARYDQTGIQEQFDAISAIDP